MCSERENGRQFFTELEAARRLRTTRNSTLVVGLGEHQAEASPSSVSGCAQGIGSC